MGQNLATVVQNLPASLLAVLTKIDGTPATGLTFSSVQCQIRKDGDPSFTPFTLTSMNFVEIGNGYYQVTFAGTDLNVIGLFAFVLFGPNLQNSPNQAQVLSPTSIQPSTPTVLPTCDITGNINDAMGQPIAGAAVTARVLGLPTIEGGTGLTDDSVNVTTDDNGVFVLSLVRLAVVEVFIPRINFRRQITVPNATAVNLFTGIP